MRRIPQNLMTLYADLADRIDEQVDEPASYSVKTVAGKKYLYASVRRGGRRVQQSLGPLTDEAAREALRGRHAMAQSKNRRSTVTALKAARIPAPPVVLGRALEAMASVGLFKRGLVLVGTAAYRCYPLLLGYHLANSSLVTNDGDLSVAAFRAPEEKIDFGVLLQSADPTFRPLWREGDKLPKAFANEDGYTIEILTRLSRGRKSPVPIEKLGVAAVSLAFQEYLVEDSIEIVVLYKAGVLIRVPSPIRYAIHKLIVAQYRQALSPKRQKDLDQARELIEILMTEDSDMVLDEIEAAKARGKAWRSAIEKSMSAANLMLI